MNCSDILPQCKRSFLVVEDAVKGNKMHILQWIETNLSHCLLAELQQDKSDNNKTDMSRTTSSSSQSSSKSSTGATQGRGLVTGYNWDPPAAANSNSSENSSTSIVFIQLIKRTSLLKSIYL
jgi:hypothetical protein